MQNLRIPGPTPLPDEVLKTMSRQMINHRGPEFKKIQDEVIANLKKLFQTKNEVFLLTGSGTGGLEAGIVNTVSPDDKVLSVSIGVFGNRFAAIAKQFGAEVIPISVEWGKAADPDEVRKALKADPKIKTVLITRSTSRAWRSTDISASRFSTSDAASRTSSFFRACRTVSMRDSAFFMDRSISSVRSS